LIILTEKGHACIAAGIATIDGIEQQLTDRLVNVVTDSCAICSPDSSTTTLEADVESRRRKPNQQPAVQTPS